MIEILLALLIAFTGIARPVDPALTQLAETRAVEIQSDFNHHYLTELNNGKWSAWGEVIGWNRGMTDPAKSIAEGWRDSPSHHEILWNPAYSLIGCGMSILDTTYYFVCIVAKPAAPVVQGDTPELLPDTAMAH